MFWRKGKPGGPEGSHGKREIEGPKLVLGSSTEGLDDGPAEFTIVPDRFRVEKVVINGAEASRRLQVLRRIEDRGDQPSREYWYDSGQPDLAGYHEDNYEVGRSRLPSVKLIDESVDSGEAAQEATDLAA